MTREELDARLVVARAQYRQGMDDGELRALRIFVVSEKPIGRYLTGSGRITRFVRWILNVDYTR